MVIEKSEEVEPTELIWVIQIAAFENYHEALILFKELEVLRDEKGKPYFNPLGDVKKTIVNLGITKTHVSLADESEHAIAFAILEI